MLKEQARNYLGGRDVVHIGGKPSGGKLGSSLDI